MHAGGRIIAAVALGLRLIFAMHAIAPREALRLQPASQTFFSVADLLNGKAMTSAECRAIDMAVWATADGASECLRFYVAEVGAHRDAVVLLHGDFVDAGNGAIPKVTAPDYGRTSVADELNDAARLADRFDRTVIILARPGTFGSSGNELRTRHTVHEARLIDAALDRIAGRYGISQYHVVGQSGGSILIGAMLAMRRDIGCAGIGSGRLALAPYTGARRDLAAEPANAPLDDQAYVGNIRASKDLRPFVLSDPADVYSAIAGQNLFVARAAAVGVPVVQLMTVSSFDKGAHHDLLSQALRVVQECVNGAPAAQIAAVIRQYATYNAGQWAHERRQPLPAATSISAALSGESAGAQ